MASAKGKHKGGTETVIRLHRRHPGQQAIANHPARFRIVMCGRRWGKSACGIREVCDVALAGQPAAWFAPSYKIALEAWRELVDRLAPVTSRMSEQDKRLELVTGGVIEVWTLDTPDPARGRKYKLAVIDEAGIVRDLLEVWQAAIRPTLVDLGGRALILGTPKGRRHGFVTLFNRGLTDDPDWQSFRASTLENPYIPAEEVEIARRELPPEVFAQEFEGVPAEDGGNPFGLDAIRECIGPLSSASPECYGVDLAKSQDYTAVVALDKDGAVCRLERWQSPWNVTRERLAAMIGDKPAQIDSTGVGDPIVEDLRKVCRKVEGFKFTAQTKQQLVEGLQLAIQTREIRFPEGFLRSELESFGFRYSGKHVSYEATVGHDDGVCALALAVLARRTRRPLVMKVI